MDSVDPNDFIDRLMYDSNAIKKNLSSNPSDLINKVLDYIYGDFDQMMWLGQYWKIDQVFKEFSGDVDIHLDLAIGLLTASLPARSRLHFYTDMFNQACNIAHRQGEYSDDLFKGLEPQVS